VETITDETRRDFPAAKRKTMAKSGTAMPDGSFPIANEEDLKNAIHLAGNAKDPAAARAHIKKRAAAIGCSSMIPDSWRSEDLDVDEPPRDKLFRRFDGDDIFDLVRSDSDEERGGMPVLAGYLAVFNEWAEIRSKQEGHFLERIAPSAFKRTFENGRRAMRVCLDHGTDPTVGNKPLGAIQTLTETERGAYYEVPLLDTSYNRDLVPALEAGLYGSSFRFSVMRDEFNPKPRASEANPDALPERTILEAKVKEFGPVSFPAYIGATAGLRSITDEYTMRRHAEESDYLEHLVNSLPREAATAPTAPARSDPAPERAARDQASDHAATPKNWWSKPTLQRRIPRSWDE
jgi:HK97 family phage prohead protease